MIRSPRAWVRDVVSHCQGDLDSDVSAKGKGLTVSTNINQEDTERTLFRSARKRSCTERPSYFLNLPRFSMKILSRRECQSLPTMSKASFSSVNSRGSLGSRHMISNRSDASCRKCNRRPESQKNGCSRHVVVSGLCHMSSSARNPVSVKDGAIRTAGMLEV